MKWCPLSLYRGRVFLFLSRSNRRRRDTASLTRREAFASLFSEHTFYVNRPFSAENEPTVKENMVTRKMPPRRQHILSFLQDFYSENGIPPTVRDIQRACDISSTSVVDYNLEKLREAGYINRRQDVARGIEILDQEGEPISNAPRVHIVGAIAAGIPIPALSTEDAGSSQEFDTVEVSPDLQRQHGQLFALRVKGTSMIDALIDDGDVVIIKPGRDANNGEMVVAWLKQEEEATLKKFYYEGRQVRLQPANSTMDPIYCSADNVEVRGKVVSVIRNLG